MQNSYVMRGFVSPSASKITHSIPRRPKYFITCAQVGQWDYHDLERRVLSRADEQKPHVILVEDTGFGTALISALKQKKLPVKAVKPEGDKKTRLLRQMSKFVNGQVFLLKSASGRTDLETELFSFPGGQHDDLVDALSQALGYEHLPYEWTEKAVENFGHLVNSLMLDRLRFYPR
jgi:predicted phage terminase large subunit-like protein